MIYLFALLASLSSLVSDPSDNEPLPAGTKIQIDTVSAQILSINTQSTSVPLTTASASSAGSAISSTTQSLNFGNGVSAAETTDSIVLNLSADVLFDFDRCDIKPVAQTSLQKVAQLIAARAKRGVTIDGYTDSKGSDAYNQKLSLARAEAVRNWLRSVGHLGNVEYSINGRGAQNPVAPNAKPDGQDNSEGRQQNRRVEITINK
jgi:outer membrane protein OmpA-like peptidoglycan-associated protein